MSSYLTKSVLTCYNISTSEVFATTLDSSLWILCFGVLELGSVLTSRVLDRVSRGTLFNSGPDLHSLLLRIELGKGLPVLEVKQLACVSLSFSVSVFVLVFVIVLVCLPVLEVKRLACLFLYLSMSLSSYLSLHWSACLYLKYGSWLASNLAPKGLIYGITGGSSSFKARSLLSLSLF